VGVSVLVSEVLEQAGFANAFSFRSGGVSPMPSGDLNLDYRSDDTKNVDENRRRFFLALKKEAPLILSRQVHSADAVLIESEAKARSLAEFSRGDAAGLPTADALLSRMSGFFLGVKTADCLPILVADPKTKAFAAIHAGWRGTVDRVTQKSVQRLRDNFGVDPGSCVAAIGPAACGLCYQVGRDVIQRFKAEFDYADVLLKELNETGRHTLEPQALLDIPAANVHQLADAGLSLANIHVAPYCTMHHNDLLFSHRREGQGGAAAVGRQISVIGRLDG
jgi:YfiH family protein